MAKHISKTRIPPTAKSKGKRQPKPALVAYKLEDAVKGIKASMGNGAKGAKAHAVDLLDLGRSLGDTTAEGQWSFEVAVLNVEASKLVVKDDKDQKDYGKAKALWARAGVQFLAKDATATASKEAPSLAAFLRLLHGKAEKDDAVRERSALRIRGKAYAKAHNLIYPKVKEGPPISATPRLFWRLRGTVQSFFDLPEHYEAHANALIAVGRDKVEVLVKALTAYLARETAASPRVVRETKADAIKAAKQAAQIAQAS